MKTPNRLLLAILFLVPLAANAQSQKAPAYADWDSLTEAQRAILVAPLRDRWDSNPDDRARMLEHAQRWATMPREQRERARHGMQRWEGMSPEQRSEARALFHAMRGLDKPQRTEFLARWRAMSPQQRAEWLKAHPAPQHAAPHRP